MKREITVHTIAESIPVDAEIYGDFSVHETTCDCCPKWTVTLNAAGLAVVNVPRKSDAVTAARYCRDNLGPLLPDDLNGPLEIRGWVREHFHDPQIRAIATWLFALPGAKRPTYCDVDEWLPKRLAEAEGGERE